MSSKVRVAMVGAGGRAMSVIYPSFHDHPDVEIVGVCEMDKERMDIALEKYGIPKQYGYSFYHYQQMIDELKPDAVAIIGQPHIMYDLWTWTLEKGCHLLIEKPLGLNYHQAQMLTYVANKNNCITQVAFQRRYSPMVTQMRDECLKRGQLIHAVCRFYKYDLTPMTGARCHMMDDCVHSIDTVRWMLGGEIVKIESHTKRIQTPDINFISATLYMDNGSTGYIINSWSSGKRVFEVEMHAPGIYVTAEHEIKATLFADGDVKGVDYDVKECAGSDQFHVYTGDYAAIDDFVKGIQTGKQPMACFDNSLKTMKAAEIILAQSILSE